MQVDKTSDLYVRTPWADARIALEQIKKGKARGSQTAIWVRTRLQSEFFHLGCLVHCHPGKVIFVAILLLSSFCVGLKSAVIHSTVEQLWVEEGGNVEKELRYREAVIGESGASTHQLLIQTAKDPDTSVLQPSNLLRHVEIMKLAVSITVNLFDITWRLKDVCYSPSIPTFDILYVDQIFENIIPCAIITPLDCFWEGSKLLGPESPVAIPGLNYKVQWTNLNPLKLLENMKTFENIFPYETLEQNMKRAGISTGYLEKPCLNPTDPECPDTSPNKHSKTVPNVGDELTGGCYGFAAKYMHWPEELIVGGVKKNKTGFIKRAHALQSVVQLMGEKELYEFWSDTYKVHHIDWTQEKAAVVLNTWQRQFSSEIQKYMKKENSSSNYNFHAFSSAALNDILNQFSQLSVIKVVIGYLLMLVYAIFSLVRWNDPVRSQCSVGIAGVVLVSVTVAAGLGFCAVLGIAFNASTTQVVPFLAMGLGVDDVFLLTHTYADQSVDNISPEEQTGILLKKTGLSVLLTSLSKMCALFAAAIIPIPALRVFSLQSAVLVMFNLAGALIVFPAIVSLDLRRRCSKRFDLICCYLPLSTNKACHMDQEILRTKQGDGLPAGKSCKKGVEECCNDSTTKHRKNNFRLLETIFSGNKMICKLGNSYSKLITKPAMRVFSLILFVVILCVSIWGALKVTDGLELTEIIPQNTNEYSFLRIQEKYFGFYNMYAVTQGDFEYPNNQKLLYEYHEAFMRVQNIIKNDDGGLPEFWLSLFRDWLFGLQKAFERDWKRGSITQERWYTNASEDGILAYKLLVQTGHVDNPIDRSLVTQVKLVDNDGVINPKAFYNYLSAWVTNDALAYGASQANLHPQPREWYHVVSEYDLKIPKSSPLVFTQLPFYLYGLTNTNTVTKVINQVRELCQKFESRGLPNFPSGIPFLFWEQYINLRQCLVIAVLLALAAVFVIISILLFNLWAALLIVLIIAGMVIQLLGIMGIFSIKLSAIPAVLLIITVGIGVHYTIHFSLSFITAIGSREKRAQMAVSHMFYPVVQGAITSLLSISVLAFSEFDFIVKYFFQILVSLVGIGLVNGLVFLPVLLSMAGPEAEIIPLVHTDRISTPSPDPVRKVKPSITCRSTSGTSRKVPTVQRHCHREPSLTTITEEPSWHSQHTNHESYTNIMGHDTGPGPTHEIIVEPEFVVETTTCSHPHMSASNADRVPCCHHTDSLPQSHFTTKVTATAKVKVEVLSPMCGPVETHGKSRRSRKHYRDSSSSSDSDNPNKNS